ncbi:PhnE/PtxC family ABC transporter permease [Leptotrichia sp.]
MIKIIVSFIRAIPTILWVLVFSVVANIGVESAIIGMSFHSIAYLIKAYSESIEEIDTGTIDALKATGASWWQIIFQAVLPSTITSILSWTFVRFEINFTNAVAVGAASGAGGIGYDMFMSGTMYFDIREIGVFVYLIFIVALILEFISYFLKNKYLKN